MVGAFSPTVNINLSGSATVHDARLVASEVERALQGLARERLVS
jgi:hypothetical protein